MSGFNLPYANGNSAGQAEFTIDGNGNVYVVYSYTSSYYWGDDYTPQNVVAKYSPSGSL